MQITAAAILLGAELNVALEKRKAAEPPPDGALSEAGRLHVFVREQ